jgi:hypothetical protein
MIEKTVILPVSTPVEVKLSVDGKGIVSLGIRINGSLNFFCLAADVTVPKFGNSASWTCTIEDIMK